MTIKDEELVSVVIVSSNRQTKLKDCLDSVLSQDYKAIEIIVVDNCSDSSTLKILREYGDKLFLQENKINLGAGIARNQGIKVAKGKYVLFMDDDAFLLEKGTISRAVCLFEENPRIGELGAIQYADKEKERISLVQPIIGYDGWTDMEMSTRRLTETSFNSKMIIATSFAMARKDVLETVGGFDPYLSHFEEDNDLSMRIKRKGYLVAINPEICICHKPGTSSRSSISAARNKAYLIIKSYDINFIISFVFATVKKLLGSKSLGQLKNSILMLSFVAFYTIMYPVILYRKKINFLKNDGWIENISYKSLNLFTNFLESTAVKILRKFIRPTYKSLFLFVTDRCNIKCEHCFYWKHTNVTDDEMTLDEFKRLAKSLRRQISSVSITGGEPFLRDDLVDICKEFIKNKKVKSLSFVTNGLLGEKIFNDIKNILKLASPKINVLVSISLDGFEETHDKIRNMPGLFAKAVESIQRLKLLQKEYKNLEVSAVTTAMKDNQREIIHLNKYVENELGVYHRINLIRSANTDIFGVDRDLISDFSPENDSGLRLKNNEIESICNYFIRKDNWQEYHKLILQYSMEILKRKRKIIDCQAPNSSIVIYPNGDISFCELLKPFGNLKYNGFNVRKLWNSTKSKTLRKRLENCVCTHPCNLGTNITSNPNLGIKSR